ncbi:MAG: ATP-binding protein [Paludisphaera borealis]|uniref:AlbA family DNA-binding domain-containing protein n=1 Tax=Paludisphaera borealis TaxID=1387353 RepID=UPI002844A293|nr:ATP-binding protein [Paludisphaera borealis]MDR3618226.1 ATP-binding protein [Paludisphaera borealis]
MSLWRKDVDDLTSDDVDVFLTGMQPEGYRLDYKLRLPGDLAKTIAAFANTLGGMIILGVAEDHATNRPIWPPTDGMDADPGLANQIIQIATEAIYPPVRVGFRQVENKRLPGKQIAVIRVDESRDAPHAVEKRREIYVYERVVNKTDRYVLADVDRIKHLMERRNVVESTRDATLASMLSRLEKELESAHNPKCWIGVSPLYPWRPICQASECHRHLKEYAAKLEVRRNTNCSVRRTPEGASMTAKFLFPQVDWVPTYAAAARADGVLGVMRTILSLDRSHEGPVSFVAYERSDRRFDVELLWKRMLELFDYAREFYKRPDVETPGLLSIDLRLRWIGGYQVFRGDQSGAAYAESEYRDSIVMPAAAFLDPSEKLEDLRKRLVYGFDLETPEGV